MFFVCAFVSPRAEPGQRPVLHSQRWRTDPFFCVWKIDELTIYQLPLPNTSNPPQHTHENSHNLVTIPTAGWTDVAHRHGTRVLGTFITEWDEGYDVCAELLSSPEKARNAATKLTHIALDHGLDGWLVNIENKVDPGSNIETLVIFLKSLTAQMRAAKSVSPSTTDAAAAAATSVLWYDSVTSSGDLAWQDRLNGKNRLFFDACDGIFTNYCWKGDYPSASALEAKARRFDVYTGIDVFGRGTWGGGGFDANKALGKIRRAGVSAALFAPAWTMENKTSGGGRVDPGKGEDWREVEHEFRSVDAEFWDKVGAAWDRPRPVPRAPEDGRGGCVPLVVNFGRGVGNAWRIRGEEVAVFGAASPAGEWDSLCLEDGLVLRVFGGVVAKKYRMVGRCGFF